MNKILVLIVLICVFLNLAASQKYSGKAITPEIDATINELMKKSYILFGWDYKKNLVFLQTNLQNIYPGTWNIQIGTSKFDYQNRNYSMNGEWWIHWYNANPYASVWIYGMQRLEEKYDSENVHMGALGENGFGKGWSNDQQQIIKNILTINQTVDELQKLLNEYVQKGNWNIITNRFNDPMVLIHAKDNKWFSYNNGIMYFAYLS